MRQRSRGASQPNTDTGHRGGAQGAIGQRLDWATNPTQLRDWGHTSIHLMTVAAKSIVQSYYGHGAAHAYYSGCSTGGAEAMEEVEYYPDDYDGVHAGSPGMSHCGGGPGANTVGGSLPPVSTSPDRDVLSALQAWVEHDRAPSSFISTKYLGDKKEAGVQFERPVCVYPTVPTYDGHGDRNAASSFRCEAAARLTRPSEP